MRLGDTIVAIASAPGRSVRGIVRLSGPATFALLDEVLGACPQERGAHAARLHMPWNEQPADGQVLAHWELACAVLIFAGPASYTGEDAAELYLPGNPALIERVVALLFDRGAAHGVRHAEPGEFTARAFLNGKLTLEQAEGVQAMIAARSDRELAAAKRLLGDQTGRQYRRLADELATALALVEAGIDFTDQEDVVAIAPADLLERISGLIEHLDELLGSHAGSEPVTELVSVVIAGAPNAGKSTLFNALLERERMVVSDIAGTTRDVVRERCEFGEAWAAGSWGPNAIELVDLAGLDVSLAAGGALEAAGQARARQAIEHGHVIVWCDPTGRFDAAGDEVARVMTDADRHGATVLRVRTKADLPSSDGDASGEGVAVCALDGWHLDVLRRAIADAACGASGGEELTLLPRHRRALAGARADLAAVAEMIEGDGEPRLDEPELVAGGLRSALNELGSVAGQISSDDVIGRIFATFCIGK